MAKTTLICKACGKEYEACRTPNPGIFRWRDIACSEECARKYIFEVQLARGEITEEPAAEPVQAEVVENVPEVNTFAAETSDETESTNEEPEPEEAMETRSWRSSRSKKK